MPLALALTLNKFHCAQLSAQLTFSQAVALALALTLRKKCCAQLSAQLNFRLKKEGYFRLRSAIGSKKSMKMRRKVERIAVFTCKSIFCTNLAQIFGIFISFLSNLYPDLWAPAQFGAHGIFRAPLNSALISEIVLALNSALKKFERRSERRSFERRSLTLWY